MALVVRESLVYRARDDLVAQIDCPRIFHSLDSIRPRVKCFIRVALPPLASSNGQLSLALPVDFHTAILR